MEVGEVVLLLGCKAPRGTWSRGVVVEVSRGKDDHVRHIRVRTADGVVSRDIRSISRLEGITENLSAP